jgi:UPF0716 family protein affecting phage T7 exclusion
VPSKRQPSKQRRAAQNRATRQALAARTEHAAQPRERSVSASRSSSGGATSSTPARGGGLLSGLFGGGGGGGGGLFGGGGGGGGGLFGGGRGTGGGLFGGGPRAAGAPGGGPVNITGAGPGGRTPGQLAVTVSLALAVLSVALFLIQRVAVDDRDEPLPFRGQLFKAVYLDARDALGGDGATHNVSIFDAYGPAVIIYGLIPLVIAIAVFVAFRRNPSSRPLTIGMLAMAALVFLVPQAFTIMVLMSLVAMAVGSFQARRAEIPLRMAQQQAAQDAAADDEALDEEDLEDDEYDEEDYDEEALDEEDYEDEDLDEDEEDLDEEDYDEEALDEGEDVDSEAADDQAPGKGKSTS